MRAVKKGAKGSKSGVTQPPVFKKRWSKKEVNGSDIAVIDIHGSTQASPVPEVEPVVTPQPTPTAEPKRGFAHFEQRVRALQAAQSNPKKVSYIPRLMPNSEHERLRAWLANYAGLTQDKSFAKSELNLHTRSRDGKSVKGLAFLYCELLPHETWYDNNLKARHLATQKISRVTRKGDHMRLAHANTPPVMLTWEASMASIEPCEGLEKYRRPPSVMELLRNNVSDEPTAEDIPEWVYTPMLKDIEVPTVKPTEYLERHNNVSGKGLVDHVDHQTLLLRKEYGKSRDPFGKKCNDQVEDVGPSETVDSSTFVGPRLNEMRMVSGRDGNGRFFNVIIDRFGNSTARLIIREKVRWKPFTRSERYLQWLVNPDYMRHLAEKTDYGGPGPHDQQAVERGYCPKLRLDFEATHHKPSCGNRVDLMESVAKKVKHNASLIHPNWRRRADHLYDELKASEISWAEYQEKILYLQHLSEQEFKHHRECVSKAIEAEDTTPTVVSTPRANPVPTIKLTDEDIDQHFCEDHMTGLLVPKKSINSAFGAMIQSTTGFFLPKKTALYQNMTRRMQQ